jgi:hypothetical protein
MKTLHALCSPIVHNNNNQAFYSQASWGRLQMKPYEKKTGTKKSEKEGKTKGDKKLNKKNKKR